MKQRIIIDRDLHNLINKLNFMFKRLVLRLFYGQGVYSMTKMQWLKITVRDTAGFVFPKTRRNNGDLMGLWWPGGGAFASLGASAPGVLASPAGWFPQQV